MIEHSGGQTVHDEIRRLNQALDKVIEALHTQKQILRQRGMGLPPGILEGMNKVQSGLQNLATQSADDAIELAQLRELAKTTALINSSLDIDQVLNGVMDTVIALTGAERGYIMLCDEHTGEMEYRIARNLDRETTDEGEFIASRTIVGEVARSGKPILTTNAMYDERFRYEDSIKFLGLRSILCVPLILKGQVTGVVYLDNRVQDAVFGEKELSLLLAFANQSALAIQNAHLYRDLEVYSLSLERAVEARTEELQHTTARIETILDNSSDVILLIRDDGTIQQVNPAFYQVFGDRAKDASEGSLMALVEPEEVERLLETLNAVIEYHQPRRVEVAARGQDDTVCNLDIAFSPVTQQNGQVTDIVCSLRDITERKLLEDQLRKTLIREMEVSELKSRYISMASHDLRAPLAVIRTSNDVLEHYSNQLSDEQRQENFARIKTNIKIMTDLLDGVLMIGKIEAGKLTFDPEPFDLGAFCQTLANEIGMVAGTRQEIIFSCSGDYTHVVMDKKLVRHIVSNLLSNAVKYSPDGSTITFDLACDNRQAVFRVQDQGIGIPATDQQRLFQTFHRAGNVGDIAGTGLGLAIVKQSVDLHGGTITFESQEGAGTTFTVTIPY